MNFEPENDLFTSLRVVVQLLYLLVVIQKIGIGSKTKFSRKKKNWFCISSIKVDLFTFWRRFYLRTECSVHQRKCHRFEFKLLLRNFHMKIFKRYMHKASRSCLTSTPSASLSLFSIPLPLFACQPLTTSFLFPRLHILRIQNKRNKLNRNPNYIFLDGCFFFREPSSH